MNLLLFISLILGIVILVFAILTFAGRTPLSKRKYYLAGTELDRGVIGIVLFIVGMLFILVFVIVWLGPKMPQGGM